MTAPAGERTWTVESLLGDRSLDDLAGEPLDAASLTVTEDPHDFGSPATAALLRVRGRTAAGQPWSAFVKVLHHLRHWPMLQHLPPEAAAAFVEMFPWREELGLWRPALTGRLPDGLRVPRLYGVAELGDDRIALWTEEVDADPSPWDEERFARAAYLLGALNARMCAPEVLAEAEFPPDFALRQWVRFGLPQGLGPLVDDGLWQHPLLRPHAGLRADLLAAAARTEEVLALLAGLRHGMPHGDASPQNLLVPRDGPDGPAGPAGPAGPDGPDGSAGSGSPAELVAIDVSFQTPAPLGSDLGQLVVGLAHAGLLAPDRLPAVEAAVLPAYAEGVASAALPGGDDVAAGYAGYLLLRSGFTAIPYDALDDPDRAAEVRDRLELTRFVLGAAARHLP